MTTQVHNTPQLRAMARRRILALLFAASVAGLIATLAQGGPAHATRPGGAHAKIDNFAFNPGELTVAVGDSVTWTNGDDIPHTVVSADGAFRSKPLDTDDEFSFSFGTPGEYPYFCSLHPRMTGKIIVQAP